MNELNLNNIATALREDKWMISQIDFINLVNQVNHYMQNPQLLKDVEVTSSEFKVDSNNTAGNQTAIIKVSGKLIKGASPLAETVLGLVNTDFIAQALDDAANDPNVKDIVLIFNTPGGNTTGVEELARKISEIDKVKPVYGWVEQMSCSAGYWLLSQCRTLAMTPSASVGSIGVLVVIDDATAALKEAGISKQAIFSGKYKLLGAPFKPLSEDERKILQADVEKTHQQFKDAILSKRQVEPEYMEGLSYSGPEALKGNLVDANLDSFGQFLTTINTTDMKSYTKVEKPQTAAPVVPVPEAVVPAVDKKAEAPEDKKEEVPGVPGTKADHGGYGKGYVMCPSCKLTYKLEDSHYVEGPEPKEPEDKVEALKDGEPDKVDPKEPEDKVEAKKAMTFDDWRNVKIGIPAKKASAFHSAITEWQKAGSNLGTI